jgi:ABC-type Fe3+-citrate transport system substrate-binding protein
MGALTELARRMEAAASLFERTVALLEERESARSGDVQKIVAAIETSQTTNQPSGRESELERKLEAAEQQIAELKAQLEAQPAPSPRKTIPASTAQLLAKQGISMLEHVEAGALDAALSGLSLEQRIAVKAQLLRAGLAG